MDLKGSLVDTNLRIYPSKNLLEYLKTIPITAEVPINIAKLVKGKNYESKNQLQIQDDKQIPVHLDSKDIENLTKIKTVITVENKETAEDIDAKTNVKDAKNSETKSKKTKANKTKSKENTNGKTESKEKTDDRTESTEKSDEKTESNEKPNDKTKLEEENTKKDELHLITTDIDWLYNYLQKQKNKGIKDVPYLHELLQGIHIDTPENQVLKRNPVLEARCVKLRAQQEAREYRKMTKSVDNVRIRFPDDSISYQLKQLNRQLIAIGQFIISIFAGFLFGFRGVEWMVGNLDFGFRLLLGVMCALVIALAEIYFLAKKLNEELNIPETTQLGGPPKFADNREEYMDYLMKPQSKKSEKAHQD